MINRVGVRLSFLRMPAAVAVMRLDSAMLRQCLLAMLTLCFSRRASALFNSK